MCIIILEVHQFIGHYLISLNPWFLVVDKLCYLKYISVTNYRGMERKYKFNIEFQYCGRRNSIFPFLFLSCVSSHPHVQVIQGYGIIEKLVCFLFLVQLNKPWFFLFWVGISTKDCICKIWHLWACHIANTLTIINIF